MPDPRLRQCLQSGTSVLVATVDAEGEPSCCRGVAFVSNDDLQTATVYVPSATAQETIANVATTRRIAVSISHPVDHATVQLKGTSRAVRIARDSESEIIVRALESWADVLDSVGLPRRIVRSMNHWPAFAIDFDVLELFDQTPGPNAGTALR